jgi:superfamily II DNA/RNA helicase
MLDMGFIDDIGFIAECTPKSRQTVMFSATFAGHVGRLAQDLLQDPERIDVASHTDTHENIEQRLHWADNPHHKDQLLEAILAQPELDQAVVFTSTQRDADWLAERLAEIGHAVAPLHGAMPQGKRNRVLMGLRRGDLKVLVATDVAARGIDVPTISHVINYGLPMKAEDYVHRIGRTGRAGRSGKAVTLAERRDLPMIRRIQHYTTQPIPVATVAGLEPTRPAPDMQQRPPRGGAPRGKGGPRPGHGGQGYGRGDYFGGNNHRGGPRQEHAGGERRAPADRSPFEHRGEQPRFEQRGDQPRFEQRAEQPRFEHRDRPGFVRADGGSAEHRGGPREARPAQPRFVPSSKPRFDSNGSNAGKRPRKSV